jgi:trans-aconitate methyltransferase
MDIKKEIKKNFENILEYFNSQRYFPTEKKLSANHKKNWLKEISKTLKKEYPNEKIFINKLTEKSILELEEV